ncbi:type II secretion system inner membrane protein GspF [Agarilytica rhodophyticola]|uniref:type II secretion system inner membrane protein GspF n=1 Tax=Agarilytica rhodophyticola TaxID=1737490 RepID=UPI000B34925F|nr:type II secretion system inner membrane protein GspF [Agarilytica rhodophyticola]
MGAYTYLALDAKGKKVKGILEGDSERHIRSQLRGRQLKPLEVKSSRKNQKEKSGDSKGFSFSFGGPTMGYRDVSLVTRQLASLVQSGLPLDEVLQAAAKQSRKPAIKTIVLQIRSRVLEGLSLTQALAELPRVFDNLYRAMVKAGESSGFLGPVLERLADYTERSQEIKQKLKSAMIYPVVMLFVCITVVTIMMVKVVPNLVTMFERNDMELPILTKVLIASSNFLVNYGVFLLLFIVALFVLFKWLVNHPKRGRHWDKIKLRMPLVGGVILQSEASRYASTLGLLANSGVPLLEALKIGSQVLSNSELRSASAEVAISVQEGTSFHRALDQVDVFPPLLVQMVASGEANGKLAEQLLHAARNQERELEFTLNTVMGLLEPAMVLFMGGTVTTIVMAILLPIFNMNQLVGG